MLYKKCDEIEDKKDEINCFGALKHPCATFLA